MNISFTPRQHRIIVTAITGVALLTLAALLVFCLRVMITFLSVFSGVFLPLAAAGVLSLLLRPAYQYLRTRWKLPPTFAVILLFCVMLLPFVLLIHFFGGVALQQINQLIASLPAMIDRVRLFLTAHAPALQSLIDAMGGEEAIKKMLETHSTGLMMLAAGGAQGVWAMLGSMAGLLGWLVLPVYLVFFLTAPPLRLDQFEQFIPFLKEETRKDMLFLVRQFVDIVVTFFRGQLSIAFIQGLIMAVGFSLCGLSYGFVLGLLFGILNLVPYLGNLLGLSVTLPIAALQPGGGTGLVVAVLIVLAVTQAVESYILTPRILGNKTGLHPMAVIFAMFFWGRAIGGVLGLILAIPLTAFLVVFWRLAKEKYIPKALP